MSKPYIEGYELDRAKMCIAGIKDNLNSVEVEVITNKRAYKRYLNEKLSNILTDVNCLISMCEEGDDSERD